ncbi:sugar-binding domain-containing protein [Puniceicoccus vermicola]|uniref:Glycosyl hydrolases family 2 sugar binding domain-containing protein n=1 Tax=Puniceicoccus vermicola TaxID=388746 RepID=A0A7X1B119_9BACT|nr:sugar-binding domain-containing protein [Puniceicoccus vermicola]MBC2603656.1 hypothetical protein [Puniceicoccus vermicola]
MLYPQRNFPREFFDLHGIWNFPHEKEETVYTSGFTPEKQVAVRSSYNEAFDEEDFRKWMKGCWYSRELSHPRVLQSERVVLRFGSDIYKAQVYLNRKLLGDHETGYIPIEFDIKELIHFGEGNLLCVRTDNVLSLETVLMDNLKKHPEAGHFAGQYPYTPIDFLPYACIQHPVSIYSTSSEAWLESVTAQTQYEVHTGIVRISGIFQGSATHAEIMILETSSTAEAEINEGHFEAELKIDVVTLWNVGEPNLDRASIRLKDESKQIYDEYDQLFVFQTVQIEGNRILLDDKPLYLQGFERHDEYRHL